MLDNTVDKFFDGFECTSTEVESVEKKRCVTCHVEKPLSAFRVNNKMRGVSTLRSDCIECEIKNKRVLRYIRKYKSYDIPPKPECCEMCGSKEELFFDHCHVHEEFRGWFCDTCNRGIAIFGDTSAGLRRAAEILERKEKEILERIKRRETLFGDDDG